MRAPLPFDKKNAEDFFKVSKAIQDALEIIRQDVALKPSRSVLSKLSGIHRNTLRNRKWPIEELVRIKEDRLKKGTDSGKSKTAHEKKLLQDTVDDLKKRLDLSREEVSKWFHQAEEYKTEIESLKSLNKLLKAKLDDQSVMIDEFRRKQELSNVTTFRRRGKDETISELT